MCARVCVLACLRAVCVRVCAVRACVQVCARVRACVCVRVYMYVRTYIYIYIHISELSISGMHHFLPKQDAFIANVNLKILPVNKAPVSRISLSNLQICV
jgi:hypothetical protein